MAITRKNSRYYVARDPLRSNLIVVSLLVAQIVSECAQPAPEVKANFAKNEASLYDYNKILVWNCSMRRNWNSSITIARREASLVGTKQILVRRKIFIEKEKIFNAISTDNVISARRRHRRIFEIRTKIITSHWIELANVKDLFSNIYIRTYQDNFSRYVHMHFTFSVKWNRVLFADRRINFRNFLNLFERKKQKEKRKVV